jgi:hypothetical protein
LESNNPTKLKAYRVDPARLGAMSSLQITSDPKDAEHRFLAGATEAIHLEWANSRAKVLSSDQEENDRNQHSITRQIREAIADPEPLKCADILAGTAP